ncbi:MAG TPA: diguanylate cyclase [Pyrinomonadaceae bacterium]|nr:diguanylate cyclase [Pyrinomonadaceae bacterium]
MNKQVPTTEPQIVQEHPQDAPAGWAEAQEKLAADLGLSILLVDGRQPPALVVSNNNSICQAFQSSPNHVGLCDPYCGDAHRRAMSAKSVTQYKCHAGLECFTLPVQIGRKRNLAVIAGRAFLTTADYQQLMERFRSGEFDSLLAKKPFSNVIFAEQKRFDLLADRLEKATKGFSNGNGSEPVIIIEPPREPESVLQKEIEQLRSEIEYRAHLTDSLQHFLERISSPEPEKTYQSILTNVQELLAAERAWLLVFDEQSNELAVKAITGAHAPLSEINRVRLGEGISGHVLESGQPLVAENIEAAGVEPASLERKFLTQSFVSYPIIIAGRRIGVLNVTDKQEAGAFNDVDLSLLEIIGPQIAVALERAEWQERATEFQLRSITDPLTGLPNRRYLEERLNEELNRSRRYDYPMSFLMIDIDDFKTYNDLNGHQAGDLALQVTAHSLKAALRSADVPCRYGGEEFCILLPQTPINEAVIIGERIRQKVASSEYAHGRSQPLGLVTISIGVSTFARHIDTAERVIAAADRALYNAKNLGKNRIEVYQP